MSAIAKVFWSGRSQAVRLPKEFRLDSQEVRVRRHGDVLILEPVSADWKWLDAIVGEVDQDFEAAALERVPDQVRPGIDDL